MQTVTTQAATSRPLIKMVTAATVIAAVTCGLSMTPAFGDNDRGNKGAHKGQSQRDWRYDRREYRPNYQQPYYYSQPVYAPPPAYYYPQQSPGISFFFPLDLR